MRIEEVFARYLTETGLVSWKPTEPDGDCFTGEKPDSPDRLVSILGSGGGEADFKFGYDQPSFQIIVRGDREDDFGSVQDRAWEIWVQLVGLGSMELPMAPYPEVPPVWVVKVEGIQSGPVPMGRDENDRFEFSLNFMTEIRVPTAHRE